MSPSQDPIEQSCSRCSLVVSWRLSLFVPPPRPFVCVVAAATPDTAAAAPRRSVPAAATAAATTVSGRVPPLRWSWSSSRSIVWFFSSIRVMLCTAKNGKFHADCRA